MICSKANAAGLKQASKALQEIKGIMTPPQVNTAESLLSKGTLLPAKVGHLADDILTCTVEQLPL